VEARTNILEEAEPDALVSFLEREHPQAIALVVAHLSPARAGHILARLPAALQTDVVRRLVDLEETDPHVLREVELAIESWFHKKRPTRPRMAGVAAVSAILSASEGSARRQILNNLTIHHRGLAQKLVPAPKPIRKFSFAEICRWPIKYLADVVLAADRRNAALALAGASAALVADLLQCLEHDEADSLSRRLTNLGPLRLTDIDRAQDTLADFASRLYGEGRILTGKRPHLTAVV
jgi:flagellar motor switch protein FliG